MVSAGVLALGAVLAGPAVGMIFGQGPLDLGAVSPRVALEVTVWLLMMALVIAAWRRGVEAVALRDKLLRGRELELAFQEEALNNHSMVATSDPQGNVTGVNEIFSRALGCSQEELLGKRETCLYPQGQDRLFGEIMRTTRSGEIWKGESPLVKKDGSVMVTQLTVVPMMDRGGRHTKTVFIRSDVTQARLAQQERHLIRCLLLLPDDVFMFDPQTFDLAYMNASALQRMGWSKPELAKRRFTDVMEKLDADRLREYTMRLKNGRKRVIQFDDQCRGASMEINLEAIEIADGSLRLVAVARDITERMQIERNRRDFLALVSHELRTPLTSIKGALRLLIAGAAGEIDKNMQSMLNIADKNSERLLSLVNDILDLEKMETGRMNFTMQRLDAGGLVEEALQNYSDYGTELGVEFTTDGLARGCAIDGDRGRLLQVMANLMSNAAKFSSAGDTVTVSLSRQGGNVRVAVADNGPGIPEAARATIFDRFTQASLAPNGGNRASTGLGLSIVKAIIEHHGGKVDFRTETGKGTTFFFDLPLCDGRSEQLSAAGDRAA